jgi:hypothetical protein
MDLRLKVSTVNRLVFGKVDLAKAIVLCFAFGFLVRSIPELLAFSSPIGFDTIYYAAVMKSGVIWPNWSAFFTSTWLLYGMIVPVQAALNTDPFLVLKVLAPVLFGLNVAGVCWFARKMFGWDVRMGLLAGAFFAFQLASLRISWDLLRNTLGMGVLLFTLPFVNKLDSKRGFACFVVLSLLTVFAHEYAAVTLLAIVLGLVLWRFLKSRTDTMDLRRVLAVLPALTVFSAGVFLRVFPVRYAVETNVINAGDAVSGNSFGVPFLVNYFSVKSAVDFYGSYWSLVSSVLVLFGLLYLSYLFLVWKGFFRSGVLSVWTGLLLVGSFGCLVVPFCALALWHRWMFMLAYPFSFFAVNGMGRLFRMFDGGGLRPRLSGKVKGMVLVTVLLGCSYLVSPVLMGGAGVSVSSVSATYVYFSDSPAVPYGDVNGVVEAMQWLDANLGAGSCVVLQRAFWYWGQLYLDSSHVVVRFESDADAGVGVALERGFGRVFFVWWNVPVGWYGVSVPEGFVAVCSFGRISVYEFVR